MEQDVLKAFVSGNPLDGLYLYIKKFSFLSQVSKSADLPKFIVIAYIKEIQRAKRKGFFIKLEDISGSWEFFIRDTLDLKKFDLVIVHGSKRNERVFLDKLITTDYESLVLLAGGKFDPERTVARAKKERYGQERSEEIEKIKSEKITVDNLPKQRSVQNRDDENEEELLDLDLIEEKNETPESFEEFEDEEGYLDEEGCNCSIFPPKDEK